MFTTAVMTVLADATTCDEWSTVFVTVSAPATPVALVIVALLQCRVHRHLCLPIGPEESV